TGAEISWCATMECLSADLRTCRHPLTEGIASWPDITPPPHRPRRRGPPRSSTKAGCAAIRTARRGCPVTTGHPSAPFTWRGSCRRAPSADRRRARLGDAGGGGLGVELVAGDGVGHRFLLALARLGQRLQHGDHHAGGVG